jgi:hypothetical protein
MSYNLSQLVAAVMDTYGHEDLDIVCKEATRRIPENELREAMETAIRHEARAQLLRPLARPRPERPATVPASSSRSWRRAQTLGRDAAEHRLGHTYYRGVHADTPVLNYSPADLEALCELWGAQAENLAAKRDRIKPFIEFMTVQEISEVAELPDEKLIELGRAL